MPYALELRQRRADLLAKARQILDGAKASKRALTPEEEADFDRLHVESETIWQQVVRQEQLQEAEARGQAPRRITGPAVRDLVRHGESCAELRVFANANPTDVPPDAVGDLIVAAVDRRRASSWAQRALAEGTDATGGFSVPTNAMPNFFDMAREASVAFNAGANLVAVETDKTKVGRITADPAIAWRAENASIAASDPTMEAVEFNLETCASLVLCSLELFEDSVNIQQLVQRMVTGAVARELDRVIFYGTGSSNEPRGIVATTGVSVVNIATNGLLPTDYGFALDQLKVLRDARFPEPTAWVMAPRSWRTLDGFADTTGQPKMFPPALSGLNKVSSTLIPTNLTVGTATGVCSDSIMGDFRQVYVALRDRARVSILRERFADAGQVGFLIWLRADVKFGQPSAFSVCRGIKAS